MKVTAIVPRGYCYGVINAIEIAKEARRKYPDDPIYILGMIVHNKYIVQALTKLNIITLDDSKKTKNELLNEINKGVVILTAHGSAQTIKDKALKKGLIVIDATCKDVTNTHNLIKRYVQAGYDVIYYGKKKHPEAEAALSIEVEKVHLISEIKDLDNLNINNDKLVLTNQTTISILDAQAMFRAVKDKYPMVVIEKEICNATRVRQEAILSLNKEIDIVFVVGDPASNNSNKLAQIAKNTNGIVTYMIESVADIKTEWLVNKKHAAITSGASTPTYLTNLVIEYLKNFDETNEKTYPKPQIDINKILD